MKPPDNPRSLNAAQSPRTKDLERVTGNENKAFDSENSPNCRVLWRSQLERCNLEEGTKKNILVLLELRNNCKEGDAEYEAGVVETLEEEEGGAIEVSVSDALLSTAKEDTISPWKKMVLDGDCMEIVSALICVSPRLRDETISPKMFVDAAKPETSAIALKLLEWGTVITKKVANALLGTGILEEDTNEEDESEKSGEDTDKEDESADEKREGKYGDIIENDEDETDLNDVKETIREEEIQYEKAEVHQGEGDNSNSNYIIEVSEEESPPSPWQNLVLSRNCRDLVKELAATSQELRDAMTDPEMLVAACLPTTADIALDLLDQGARVDFEVYSALLKKSLLPPPPYDIEASLGKGALTDSGFGPEGEWTRLMSLVFESSDITRALVSKLMGANDAIRKAVVSSSMIFNSIMRAQGVQDSSFVFLTSHGGRHAVPDEVADWLLAPRSKENESVDNSEPDSSIWTSMILRVLNVPQPRGKGTKRNLAPLPPLLERISSLNPKLRRAMQRPEMLMATAIPSRASICLRLIKLGARVKTVCSKLLLKTTNVPSGDLVVRGYKGRKHTAFGLYRAIPGNDGICCGRRIYRQQIDADTGMIAHALWFGSSEGNGQWLLTSEDKIGQVELSASDGTLVAFCEDMALHPVQISSPWKPLRTVKVEVVMHTVTLINALVLAESDAIESSRDSQERSDDLTLLLDRMVQDNKTLASGVTQCRVAQKKKTAKEASCCELVDKGKKQFCLPDVAAGSPRNYWAEQLLREPQGSVVVEDTYEAENTEKDVDELNKTDSAANINNNVNEGDKCNDDIELEEKAQPLVKKSMLKTEESSASGEVNLSHSEGEPGKEDTEKAPELLRTNPSSTSHTPRKYAFGTSRVLY